MNVESARSLVSPLRLEALKVGGFDPANKHAPEFRIEFLKVNLRGPVTGWLLHREKPAIPHAITSGHVLRHLLGAGALSVNIIQK